MYVQHFMLIFQTESGFSKKRCSDVQDWGQVCRFQGKNCGGFGAFTRVTATNDRNQVTARVTPTFFLTAILAVGLYGRWCGGGDGPFIVKSTF
jgi:hypothetical protein